jgi:sugar phosphate isomerase/epimerase
MADYTINNIYQGGYSSLNPNKSYGSIFSGYTVNAGDFGMGTDARTANVLQEASSKLNMGVGTIELSQVSQETFEQIPKGQLKEVQRLAELTGTDVTLHAPVVSPAGMTQQGFDEVQRKATEKSMILAMERAHELNPKGNSPVTFHASGALPSSTMKPGKKEGEKEYQKMIAINVESGKMIPLEPETMFYPGKKTALKPGVEERLRKKELTHEEVNKNKSQYIDKISLEEGWKRGAEDRLSNLNDTEWDNSISQLIMNKERADQIIQENIRLIPKETLQKVFEKIYKKEDLNPEQQEIYNHIKNTKVYLDETQQHLQGLFHKAYKYGNEEDRKKLKKFSDQFVKELKEDSTIEGESRAMQNLMINLKEEINPQMYIPVDQFAVDKSSETFSNVALENYKKFKNEASIISIENPPAGGAISTGEHLKELVEKTKEKFVKKAVENKLMSESEAKKQADRLIGVTWDVGHINMLRKQGFETKDIIKETEHIAPLVKHVHLSDNFGLEHSELPMGMGNAPYKEMLEKIGKEGYKGKKVIEALHWWQHFKTPPLKETMEAFGSPIYSGGNYSWNQTLPFQEGYFSGYGMMLPGVNYQTFGAGFSRLPAELGGQQQGTQGSRMSGNPME